MNRNDDDPGLSAEQEAHVRRLLADARHTEPTPDAVVARLDRVLADLAGEPAREATVVRLAARRRRAATMLVAAAASVAAVVGVGAVVSNTGSGDDAESATSADEAGAPAAAPEEEALSDGDALSDLGAPAEGRARYGLSQRRQPFAVEVEEFARDAGVLQRRALTHLASADTRSGAELDAGYLARVRDRTVCEPGAWGAGSYIAVLYDDAEGWVVLRRPRGDTQIADLFLCGSDSVVRSVTLPHP